MRLSAILVASALVAGCSGDEDSCFSDDECGSMLVCDRAAGQCVSPPGDCNGYCMKVAQCGGETRDECVKNSCGASFLEYYGDTYGQDCRQAWLDLMECESNLSCDEYGQYIADVDPETGTAPYCQAELRAKNSEC